MSTEKEQNTKKKIKINKVANRFLPLTESVINGLEPEATIKDFTILGVIGEGSFGKVSLVRHNKTGSEYAIKQISKLDKNNQEGKTYFRREIEIMYKIHQNNIVRLFNHFEDNEYCYFVMEYIENGNLFSQPCWKNNNCFSSYDVAKIIKEVICAVYYLHNMDPPIIHRDIKPENVLLASGMVAKLTDFGWSNYMNEGYKRTTVCGTPVYLAPEMVNKTGHDEKVDIWCIGILLFELMTGIQPWSGNDIQTVKYNINRLKINWAKNMNRTAADLISKIIRNNPEERISLRNMLNHPFFTQYFSNPTSCLKRPDNTQYKIFIISKDHPITWNPIFTGDNYGLRLKPYLGNVFSTQSLNQYNYDNLLQRYDNLKNDYNQLRSVGFSNTALDSLRRELKEKEDKINQLVGRNTGNGLGYTWYKSEYNNNEWETTYNDLKNENYDLKNKVNLYQTHFQSQNNPIFLDNDLLNIRNSNIQNNKTEFSNAITQLRTNIDNYTQNDYNTIIMMKNNEIEKLKKQERIRREKEKQQFTALINKYDQTLTMGERENEKLKMRLKELQGYFG